MEMLRCPSRGYLKNIVKIKDQKLIAAKIQLLIFLGIRVEQE